MIRSDQARTAGADTAARIDELEARLALQDQTLHELGNEVYRQQLAIARLEEQLRALTERMLAFAAAEPEAPTDERPPHY